MRNLIIVKKGDQAITNRDVTDLTEDEVLAVTSAMKTEYPEADLQWIKHTCGDNGCTEKAFVPVASKPVEKPEAKPVPKPKPPKPPKPPEKDEQVKAVRRANNRGG